MTFATTEMVGRRFGRWTVESYDGRNKSRHAMFVCVCDCGRRGTVAGSALRRRASTQCHLCASRLAAAIARTYAPRGPEPEIDPGVTCQRCGLRGAHECLRGDAMKGLGVWL